MAERNREPGRTPGRAATGARPSVFRLCRLSAPVPAARVRRGPFLLRIAGAATGCAWLAACLVLLAALALPADAQTLEERRRSGDCRDLNYWGPNCGIGSSIDGRASGYREMGEIQSAGDKDLWSVILQRGRTYVIEVKGAGDPGGDNGGTLADPDVEIYELSWDERTGWSGAQRASNDDASGTNKNARVLYTYPIGDEPQTPIGIRVSGVSGTAGSYTVTVKRVPFAFEALQLTETTDCGTSRSTACGMNVGDTVGGSIGTLGDIDYWIVTLQAERTYRFDARGVDTNDGGLRDPGMTLIDATGTRDLEEVPEDDSGVGKNALLTYTTSEGKGGSYIVKVESPKFKVESTNPARGTYTLSVVELPIALTTTETTDCANDISTTCNILVGGTATGEIAPTGADTDYWAVTLEAGKMYQIDLKGADTGDGTLPNPSFFVRNRDGISEFAENNSGTDRNARFILTVQEGKGGRYFIDAGSANAVPGSYTLSVLQVVPLPHAVIDETADCAAGQHTTCSIDVPGTVRGTLSSVYDWDAWEVELAEGKTYIIDARGADSGDIDSGGGTLPDPELQLLVLDAGLISVSAYDHDSGTGKDARITHSIASGLGGTYYIRVRPIVATDGGTYTLSIVEQSGQQREEEPPPATSPSTSLTAEFRDVPAEHDGSSAFDLELHFSEAPKGLSYRTLSGGSFFDISNGTVTKAKRLVKRDNSGWRITVEPASDADVAIGLPPAPPAADCAEAAVVCTADGTRLSAGAAATVPGPASFSVADAAVQEGPNATLDFTVTLSRARHEATTVDYATSDGTATAGADYSADSGTLTFEAGETGKTVSVAVLDDDHDEGSETMTFTLSNPVPAATAKLGDATATGTIANTDPIPQAWIARFGRTVADQVTTAVADRFRAPRRPGVELTLAGERVGGRIAAEDEAARRDREARGKLEALSDWLRHGAAERDGGPAGSRAVEPRELLTGSSFALTGEVDEGRRGTVALWGRGAVSSFDGREGALSLDGEVVSGMLGADWTRGPWTAGLLLSHARGTGSWRGDGAGTLSSSLTGAFPYGRHEVSERLSVWGVAGYGAGTLRVTPEGGTAIDADLDLAMAASGLRGTVLRAGADGGPELAATADGMAVRTTSAAARAGDGGRLAAARATVTRLRLGLEGSWRGLTIGTGTLAPRLEVGLRHDGGDAETGFGLDLGGGLALTDPGSGVQAEVRGRGLLTHESAGFRERGFSGALSWDPTPGSDRGGSLSLTQTVGASASGGVGALLSQSTMAGLAANDNGGGDDLKSRRLEIKLGYGFSVLGDRFTSIPEIGVGLTDTGRDYSLAWRLKRDMRGDAGSLELSLEATRRESANDNTRPEHGIGFRMTARW